MCGILALFGSSLSQEELRKLLIKCSEKIRHRGPDWSGYTTGPGFAIGHERLAIMDPESGAQPLVSRDGKMVLAVNGEVYNYKELLKELSDAGAPYEPQTGSDCEVILPLYRKDGPSFVSRLTGMFSFVLWDKEEEAYCAFRDHLGITPLYIGWGEDGSVWFASELKALAAQCATFKQFPPGHWYSSATGEFKRWYEPNYVLHEAVPSNPLDLAGLRDAFTQAVRRRMMADVPWGVLLSGGLDSSLVASIASRLRKENPDSASAFFPKLHSFSIGLEGSPDLAAAKQVAEFLGTKHHSYVYTIQEGLDAIRQVIYHLETYDVTTIRAATPMFLMSRKIKALGVKMVLSGEGADEMFGGYLYNHHCPSPEEMYLESRDKVMGLYQFDCLRANKSTSAWGLEARVPFLDVHFLDYVMSLDPALKMPANCERKIEKYILRKAFDTPDSPYLPDEVLWRQKEQFSDGVGYGWIDALRDVADTEVSKPMMTAAEHRFPYNTPATKEGYRYRAIFHEYYPQRSAEQTVPSGPSIACSTGRAIKWSKSFEQRADCSGRAVAGVHASAYTQDWSVASKASAGAATEPEEEGHVKKRARVE